MSVTRRGTDKLYTCDGCGISSEWMDCREHVPLGWMGIQRKDSAFGWKRDQWTTLFLMCNKCATAVELAMNIAIREKTTLGEILAQFSPQPADISLGITRE